jgi:ribosome-associated protein
MLYIANGITIAESEIKEEFVRASGPGGQHVNKTASAVQLRFDVAHSPSLPEDVRARVRQLAASRLTGEGELIIEAKRFRSQEQNRRDARGRLTELLRQATIKPRKRRATKPTLAARERRLHGKQRRAEVKRQRGPGGKDE